MNFCVPHKGCRQGNNIVGLFLNKIGLKSPSSRLSFVKITNLLEKDLNYDFMAFVLQKEITQNNRCHFIKIDVGSHDWQYLVGLPKFSYALKWTRVSK